MVDSGGISNATRTVSLGKSLEGITQNYRRTGQVFKYKARVYQTKYDKEPWQEKLGLLPVEEPEGGSIVMSRSR